MGLGLVALILAILALVAFAVVARPPVPPRPSRYSPLGVGLMLLTLAWVAQTVIQSGWHWVVR